MPSIWLHLNRGILFFFFLTLFHFGYAGSSSGAWASLVIGHGLQGVGSVAVHGLVAPWHVGS